MYLAIIIVSLCFYTGVMSLTHEVVGDDHPISGEDFRQALAKQIGIKVKSIIPYYIACILMHSIIFILAFDLTMIHWHLF